MVTISHVVVVNFLTRLSPTVPGDKFEDLKDDDDHYAGLPSTSKTN